MLGVQHWGKKRSRSWVRFGGMSGGGTGLRVGRAEGLRRTQPGSATEPVVPEPRVSTRRSRAARTDLTRLRGCGRYRFCRFAPIQGCQDHAGSKRERRSDPALRGYQKPRAVACAPAALRLREAPLSLGLV